jgi:hypothetical protein
MMTDEELALWDRGRSLANFHIHAVAMQAARFRSAIKEPDNRFVLRPVAEFEFLCVSLVRLKRAAQLAATIPSIKVKMETAIAAYDAAIPRLDTLRNVAEHFDDYVLEQGRDKSLTPPEFRAGLQVMSFSENEVFWFDTALNVDDCLKAAEALFHAIKMARH